MNLFGMRVIFWIQILLLLMTDTAKAIKTMDKKVHDLFKTVKLILF